MRAGYAVFCDGVGIGIRTGICIGTGIAADSLKKSVKAFGDVFFAAESYAAEVFGDGDYPAEKIGGGIGVKFHEVGIALKGDIRLNAGDEDLRAL